MLWSLAVPSDNERGPQYLAQALTALHKACSEREAFELLVGRHGEEVGLGCRVPPRLARSVRALLLAAYPDL